MRSLLASYSKPILQLLPYDTLLQLKMQPAESTATGVIYAPQMRETHVCATLTHTCSCLELTCVTLDCRCLGALTPATLAPCWVDSLFVMYT